MDLESGENIYQVIMNKSWINLAAFNVIMIDECTDKSLIIGAEKYKN